MIISFLMFAVALALRTLPHKRTLYHLSKQSRLKSYALNDKLSYIQNEVRLSDVINYFLPDVHPVSSNDDKFMATCPFHDDRNPSLYINDIKGNYRCFSCGASGNAVNFVRANQNLRFPDAIAKIIELFPPPPDRVTIDGTLTEMRKPLHSARALRRNLPPYPPTKSTRLTKLRNATREKVGSQQHEVEPSVILAMMSAADTYFQTKLDKDPSSIKVHAHLRSRKLSQETISAFHLGYASFPSKVTHMPSLASRFVVNGVENAARAAPSLTAYLLHKGFALEDLVAVGFTIISPPAHSSSSASQSMPSSSSSSSISLLPTTLECDSTTVETTINVKNSIKIRADTKAVHYYDRFRDRLMVAIKNDKGQIVAFGGRAMASSSSILSAATTTTSSSLQSSFSGDEEEVDFYLSANEFDGDDDEQINGKYGDTLLDTSNDVDSKSNNKSTHRTPAKYVNSPTSSLFIKGSMLYGFDVARTSIATNKRVLVVEGYFDVISLHDCGVTNAVACMGTAISLDQLKLAAEASLSPLTEVTNQHSTETDICNQNAEESDINSTINTIISVDEMSSNSATSNNINNIKNDNKNLNEVVLLLDADTAGRSAVNRVCRQVLMQPQRQLRNNPSKQNVSNDDMELFRLKLADNVRVASIDCLLNPVSLSRLEAFCFPPSDKNDDANSNNSYDNDTASSATISIETTVREQLQQLGHLKDSSDLCVSVLSIAQLLLLLSSSQSKLTPAAVMEIIVESAIDWRHWMINWIIDDDVSFSSSTGAMSNVHNRQGNSKGVTTVTSSLAKFIHKCTCSSFDVATANISTGTTNKFDKTSLISYAVNRASSSTKGGGKVISENELITAVQALGSSSSTSTTKTARGQQQHQINISAKSWSPAAAVAAAVLPSETTAVKSSKSTDNYVTDDGDDDDDDDDGGVDAKINDEDTEAELYGIKKKYNRISQSKNMPCHRSITRDWHHKAKINELFTSSPIDNDNNDTINSDKDGLEETLSTSPDEKLYSIASNPSIAGDDPNTISSSDSNNDSIIMNTESELSAVAKMSVDNSADGLSADSTLGSSSVHQSVTSTSILIKATDKSSNNNDGGGSSGTDEDGISEDSIPVPPTVTFTVKKWKSSKSKT